MSYREGMHRLDISESTMHRLIQEGEVLVAPAPKRNKLVRDSVEAYIARQVNRANGTGSYAPPLAIKQLDRKSPGSVPPRHPKKIRAS